ncbi:syntaxin-binding protein 5-like [Heracleum sosnowskyi]|uniref:Syntaxin-binding protein 5-like n=1 Tax=Heracleum sosnowskyi TaxID=360622 RepID=A0AAD8H741_9APIA|nr:syntaxin-binding protein 5-like [Heracleum sosnowskyi]
MFVKKLVEKASLKKPGGNPDGLKAEDVNPRVVFHYGIPSRCSILAHDSTHKILAISTKDGRIKLFGNGHSQTLLESSESVPSKFLQFMENEGILLNINVDNHIEVWDIDRKFLTCVHIFKEEVTSISVSPHTEYMYIGDNAGNISVCKVDRESCKLVQMEYRIPFSASHGKRTFLS